MAASRPLEERFFTPRAGWAGWKATRDEGLLPLAGGRRDPRAELEAEVAALFAPEPGGGVQHPRCRFPARAAWLEERLGLDPARLPPADCSKYEAWRSLMDAGSVSLIFASAYMDNPSSMFGHTFLRMERSAPGEDRRLLDNTLNYAAFTGDDGGVTFALKGLLGLYPGTYTVMPYYMKIQEYNNIDNRDLWEYQLALSTAEVDRLAAHAWEMGPAEFPYYFFSKNCSYQLMPVLEAAAPRPSLMPGSPPIVGPVDTLIAVREAPGLVSAVHHRPSHATVMNQRRRQLTAAEDRAAKAYADGRVDAGDALSAGFSPERRALVLDAAEDYILYKKGYAPDVPESVRALERPILVRRARVAAVTPEPPPPSWAAPPEEGHLRHRLMVGEGFYNGGSFTELSWRPGYHDLLDRPHGYLPGAEIYGFSWRARYDKDQKHFYVRDLRLVEILSLAPYDSWTHSPSWSGWHGPRHGFRVGQAGLSFLWSTKATWAAGSPRRPGGPGASSPSDWSQLGGRRRLAAARRLHRGRRAARRTRGRFGLSRARPVRRGADGAGVRRSHAEQSPAPGPELGAVAGPRAARRGIAARAVSGSGILCDFLSLKPRLGAVLLCGCTNVFLQPDRALHLSPDRVGAKWEEVRSSSRRTAPS